MITNLLEWVRPESRKADPRRGEDGRLEANDQALARVADNDAVYVALTDHAYAHANGAVDQALAPRLTPEERAYYAGKAQGLVDYLNAIESLRVRAREEMARRAKRP